MTGQTANATEAEAGYKLWVLDMPIRLHLRFPIYNQQSITRDVRTLRSLLQSNRAGGSLFRDAAIGPRMAERTHGGREHADLPPQLRRAIAGQVERERQPIRFENHALQPGRFDDLLCSHSTMG